MVAEILPWLESFSTQLWRRWQQHTVSQAFCIHGRAGIGKARLLARFAQASFCEHLQGSSACAMDPCGNCQPCRLIASNEHPDLLIVRPKKASGILGIDQIRELTAFGACTAFSSHQIVIIQPLQGMTLAAANALLKMLEEPTPKLYFFCATHQVSQLIPTIRSRLELMRLPMPQQQLSRSWLQERVGEFESVNSLKVDMAIDLSISAPLKALALLSRAYPDVGNTIADDWLDEQAATDPKAGPIDLLERAELLFARFDAKEGLTAPNIRQMLEGLDLSEVRQLFEVWFDAKLRVLLDKSSHQSVEIEILWNQFKQLMVVFTRGQRHSQLAVNLQLIQISERWGGLSDHLHSFDR